MNNKNLIIFQLKYLFKILSEISEELNFNVVEAENKKDLANNTKSYKNFIILTKSKNLNLINQLIINDKPITIIKLIEKINIEFIKNQFVSQSKLNINNYVLNLNSREIVKEDKKLKLTEKEINILVYLSKNNIPVKIEELEKNVWKYHSEIETHTVETHIYRLRKKIIETFDDEKFIISNKNGYQIN